ncbi:MAG: hypothetical protein O6913_08285, partial [Chloroflexi bacterium]|nr:hypothetical protein [Chloroflexota bacterium]
MPDDSPTSVLRLIPQVDQLLQTAAFEELVAGSSRHRVVAELRAELAGVRSQAREGRITEADLTAEALAGRVGARLGRTSRSYYHRVINA